MPQLFIYRSVPVILCLMACFSMRGQDTNITFKDMDRAGVLYDEGRELYDQERFREAADKYAASFDLIKSNKKAAYNAACCYSKANEKDLAIKYAYKALALGIYDFEQDPDFENIRNSTAFFELVGMAKMMKKQVNQQSVEPLIILPPGYDEQKQYPLLIAFHAFGSSPSEISAQYKQAAAANNCILMCSRGSKPLGKNMFAWTMDQDEYERVLEEIEMTKRKYSVNPSRIMLTGFSTGGGYMCYALGMVFSDKFCGLLPITGTLPNNVSIERMKNKNIKIEAIVGIRDNQSIIRQNEQALRDFKANNIAFKLLKFDVNNDFPPEKDTVISEAIKWFLNG